MAFTKRGASNESGFNAVPSGYRVGGDRCSNAGDYNHFGYYTYFWSSTEVDGKISCVGDNGSSALSRSILHDADIIGTRMYYGKNYGESVRCIKSAP